MNINFDQISFTGIHDNMVVHTPTNIPFDFLSRSKRRFSTSSTL